MPFPGFDQSIPGNSPGPGVHAEMLYIFPCWHRMFLRTEGVTAAIRRTYRNRPCTARALQDRSEEPAWPCVNITYDSAVICAGQYEAAFIYLHDTRQMGLFRLMFYLCAGHITLQLVVDRRWMLLHTVFYHCCILAGHLHSSLWLRNENMKAFSCLRGPSLLLLHGQ